VVTEISQVLYDQMTDPKADNASVSRPRPPTPTPTPIPTSSDSGGAFSSTSYHEIHSEPCLQEKRAQEAGSGGVVVCQCLWYTHLLLLLLTLCWLWVPHL